MDAVSQHGGRARPPRLESWAARAGIAVIVALSIWVGYDYWSDRDEPLAILTIGAELVAFAGLGVAVHQFSRHAWGRGFGAVIVTSLAAAWCALTMFQKIGADTREEAIATAKERPAYVFASNAADTARDLLQSRLTRPNPRPTCTCPETIRSWEAAEASAIDRLRNERDAAVAQMEAAIPEPEMDWIALARGAGVEIAKLLGFLVFALTLLPPPKRATGPPVESQPPAQPVQPRQPFEVVEGGLSTGASTAQPAPGAPRQGWWSSLKSMGKSAVGVGVGVVVAPQPTLLPPAGGSTSSANQPLESAVERLAAPIAESELPRLANQYAATTKLGERRIAARLSDHAGREITRHQVRIWLGREPARAA